MYVCVDSFSSSIQYLVRSNLFYFLSCVCSCARLWFLFTFPSSGLVFVDSFSTYLMKVVVFQCGVPCITSLHLSQLHLCLERLECVARPTPFSTLSVLFVTNCEHDFANFWYNGAGFVSSVILYQIVNVRLANACRW